LPVASTLLLVWIGKLPVVVTLDEAYEPHPLLEVYNVNNRRFTEFFDRYFHISLPIVTKHELSLPFPPRNLPIKFGTNPSTIFLVIVVTDRHRQTHKPTPVKTYSLAFAGRMIALG